MGYSVVKGKRGKHATKPHRAGEGAEKTSGAWRSEVVWSRV
jgi:hypothetical protein